MSTSILSQPELILRVSNYIIEKRVGLLGDLVSYAGDPVRYNRRIRFLCQLSEFESQLLKKISSFTTDDLRDFDAAFQNIKKEINMIIDLNS